MAIEGNFVEQIVDMVTGLTSAEKLEISQAIYIETFDINDFTNAHTFRPGVRDGSVIPIVGLVDKYCTMPAGNEQSCDLNECDITLNFAAKKWGLGEYNCRIPVCMRTFTEDFLVFWRMYRQRLENPIEQPDAQAFLAYLTSIVEDRIKGTTWRVGYWGDTSATLNNLIKNNDGFWVQAEAGGGIIDTITMAGTAPTGEEIVNAVKDALEENDALWLSAPDLVIKMGWSMAKKVVIYLNNLGIKNPYDCDCVNPDGLVSSSRFTVEGLRLFGIPVEAHREIDESGNCIEGSNKWQLLITRKSNLLVGTNETDKMSMFDIFYDKKDRKIYMDSMVYVGVSLLLDDYIYLTTQSGS